MTQLFTVFTQNDYVMALLAFLLVYFGLRMVVRTVIAQLKRVTSKTRIVWDDMVIEFFRSIHTLCYVALAVYAASQFLEIRENWQFWLNSIALIIVVVSVTSSFQKFLLKGIKKVLRKKAKAAGESEESSEAVSQFMGTIVKVVLWAVVAVLILQNLGFKVNALLGSLGVLGIAVGFAMQHVLVDFFAFFSIYFDKPFAVGDYILIGETGGTVKHIGIKTTRIQTLRGEEMVVSNTNLTSAAVHNFKQLEKRRVVFTFGVVYQTPVAKLKKIPDIVTKIFDDIDSVELKRVHLIALADSSLNFEVEYYVTDKEYLTYVQAQHDVNIELLTRFEKQKIEFAYPTQTVYVSK